jgi:hypothetical protein
MTGLVLAAFLEAGWAGCGMLATEEVPSAELIGKWRALQPFIVEPVKISGIYKDSDIDAIAFEYATGLERARFWARLESSLRNTRWRVIAETGQGREYERRFARDEPSPERPDAAAFSSVERLRIAYAAGKGKAVVCYVQADASAQAVTFAATPEALWAEKKLWPRCLSAENR